MRIKNSIIAIICTVAMVTVSCKDDFLDTTYTNGISKTTATKLAASDPDALNGYLLGVFNFMAQSNVAGNGNHDDFSVMSVLHSTDMMGETMVQSKSHWFTYDYQLANRNDNYRRTNIDWLTFYTLIAKANEIINFFPEEPTTAGSKGILGQAYAVRGMAYYYLIQLYQHPTTDGETLNTGAAGVPLRYADVEIEANGWSEDDLTVKSGRNTVGEVFTQIESDLKYSVELLDAGYSRPAKYYINASVAKGLLARYYLLTRQWELAASTANAARSGYSMMSTDDLHDGFMDIENSEWMWGFDHNTETQTTYASFFSHISCLGAGYAGLNYAPRLIDARLYSNISDTDERKTLFCGPEGPTVDQVAVNKDDRAAAKLPYANLKFGDDGNWTMDYMYMRAAEMVLIEAEAYAQQGNAAQAATVLAELMADRDSEWAETSVTVDDIYLQRRIELWGEGFEYFDLKRLYKGIDRSYEGTNHRSGVQLAVAAGDKRWIYQLPLSEIQENDQISEDDNNE